MELKVISEKEYNDYALKNEFISIYQIPEWGKLKEINGWKSHLLGLYDGKKLKGVTLLLQKKVPLGFSLFYAPRGFLFDLNDKELLSNWTKELKKYIKKYRGFMVKVDPNVIYALYDGDGKNKNVINGEVINNFKCLKYKHYGYTMDFETMQPRWLCRFKLNSNYEDTFNSFSKSTRKNILKLGNFGVHVRKIDISEIDTFVDILKKAGDAKDFIIRPASYYKKMYELMDKYVYLYVTYIDTKEYLDNVIKEKDEINKELSNLNKEMEKVNVGKKLTEHKNILEQKLVKIDEEIEYAKSLTKNKTIDIGALMSLFIGNEGITFMSGTIPEYKKFNPKYAYYNEHIKECIKQHKEYCNFYGISGNIDLNSKYYSIYEIKKGYNPEIVELVGEFDLITNKLVYFGYNLALKVYKLLKKLH